MYPYNPHHKVPFPYEIIELFTTSTMEAVHSVPLEFDTLYFAIPPGEPYDQLTKMFMMFDSEVWIAITVTFLIGLVAIQIVNRLSRQLQSLIYGSNITTPTLNLISIFLCGGQIRTPPNSFARFLLILFIIFSLIIRTCHQSTLFRFLQDDLRKPRVTSFDELVYENFTFYGFERLQDNEAHKEQGLK